MSRSRSAVGVPAPSSGSHPSHSSTLQSLPPLQHGGSQRANPVTLPTTGSAAAIGSVFDFELRSSSSSLPAKTPSHTSLAPVKGWASLTATAAANTAAIARRTPGAVYEGNSKSMQHSASAQALPSHLQSTSDKIDFFLNWNKGLSDEGNPAVSGILTARTRYDRLAQSVASVPFQHQEEKTPGSSPLKSTTPLRSLNASASSPALHGSHSRTMLHSQSHSSLHGPTTHLPHSNYIPPSDFLATFIPESRGVAVPVAAENARAKALADKFATLIGNRNARKKKTKTNKNTNSRLSGMQSSASGEQSRAESGGESSDDDVDLSDLLSSNSSLLKRKPGTQAGSAILNQIQSIIRAVGEEKEILLGSNKSKHKSSSGGDGFDDDEGPSRTAATNGKQGETKSNPNDDAQLQTVIQAYMEQSGIAGSVAAGGAAGTIKERDGTTTITTAKITRDVRLILNYLKTNPILREELYDRIQQREEAKKARMQAAGIVFRNRVKENKKAAWHWTEEAREAQRVDNARREKERIARQQETKQAIDMIWMRRAIDRDAALMHRFGPEMLARQARENAENERMAHVQWGWIMLSQLIPITIRFKWKLKEIVHARIQREAHSFVVPFVKRNYILHISAKLNENRAAALNKIKKVLVRYIIRWKFTKRRNACLAVWKFMTLVKNAHAIRQGLKDSSLRSQIIKIQTWWKQQIQLIESQAALVELKWNQRENLLLKNFAKNQKKEARKNAMTKKQETGGSSSFASPTAKGRKLKRVDPTSDFTSTLANFNFNSPAGGMPDEGQAMAPKKLPKPQKREALLRYVKKKRAMFRAALRQHVHVLAAWNDEHKHEIELRKARKELGLKSGSKHSSDSDSLLQPPPRPCLRLIPTNAEMDALILQASKQYVLNKLRETTHAPPSVSLSGMSPSSRSLQMNNENGNHYNALTAFMPGSPSSDVNVRLRHLTIGEQTKAKRELLDSNKNQIAEEDDSDA